MTTVDEAPLQIVLSQPDEHLVKLSAEELQRYVRQLFGFSPPVRRGQGWVGPFMGENLRRGALVAAMAEIASEFIDGPTGDGLGHVNPVRTSATPALERASPPNAAI